MRGYVAVVNRTLKGFNFNFIVNFHQKIYK